MSARRAGTGQAIQLSGLPEVNKLLRALPGKVAKRVIGKAMKAALKPVQAASKANAPVKTGQLRKAIRVLAGRSRGGRIVYKVVMGKGDFVGDEFYGSFQEYGWKTGKRGSSGRKVVPGKHFMKRAFDATKDRAKADCEAAILAGVEKEARG